jgi:hypothetical protein
MEETGKELLGFDRNFKRLHDKWIDRKGIQAVRRNSSVRTEKAMKRFLCQTFTTPDHVKAACGIKIER